MKKLRAFSNKSSPVPHQLPSFEKPQTPIKSTQSPIHSSPNSVSSSLGGSIDQLSPELVPIVSLLSAQSKRKYNEGVLMLLKDLNSDGNPSERKWNEVFAILIGNQLTYWDADSLELGGDNIKPSYINLSDSSFKVCKNLPSSGSNINNVIVLSTTLKNRFLLQFSEDDEFKNWYCAFRLAAFEYKSLQEAYTASLLSSKGSLLSNIKTILAEKKFNYEDWASVRFGAGMPWKRCYAVIEPCKRKKKSIEKGRISFYENEKKNKKSLMATISVADFVYAVYPRNYLVIDQSTMIKLDCKIQFEVKETPKDCSIFIMPEQHSAVPGYDTLIRFLIPVMDAFALYGRPVKLKAYKSDPESLLFAMPVLPNVYYLELNDVINSTTNINWSQFEWDEHIKTILQTKLSKGHTGVPPDSNLSSKALTAPGFSIDPMEYLINSPNFSNNGNFVSPISNSFPQNHSDKSSEKLVFHGDDRSQLKEGEREREREREKTPVKLNVPPKNNSNQRTPPSQNETFDSSVSPQLVNIYNKYSQLPDNENMYNKMARMNLSSEQPSDNLYPDDDDDDYNDDDDDDNADVFIAKPTGPQMDRNLSPFSAFNSSFKESMKPNLEYQSKDGDLRGQNLRRGPVPAPNSFLNIPKQRSPESPLKKNIAATTIEGNNFYPSMSDEDDDNENDDDMIFSDPTPSSSKKDSEELDFSPSIEQKGTFGGQKQNPKISTSLFDEPVINPYAKYADSPHTPVDQQMPPLGPGPVRPFRQHQQPLPPLQTKPHPNQMHRPQYPNKGYNNGSPKPPQGFQQKPPLVPSHGQYSQRPNMNSPGLIPPHHYHHQQQQQQQQQPAQNIPQQQPSYGPSSPVNQFMPQFPKQGYGAAPFQQQPQQKAYYPPVQNQGYHRPPPQMSMPPYRGAPPPQQPQNYPPHNMNRKPPPGPNGGQTVQRQQYHQTQSNSGKSFKHDPYAIARSS